MISPSYPPTSSGISFEELKEQAKPTPVSKMIIALNSKQVYAGTVPEATKQKRRAQNRVAKASRKKNRSK